MERAGGKLEEKHVDYYDLWALRSVALGVDYDCWQDARAVEQRGTCNAYEVRIHPRARLCCRSRAPSTASPLPLAALWSRYAECSYDGELTCEHVAFHCACSPRVRIGIAPYLVQGCGDGAPSP